MTSEQKFGENIIKRKSILNFSNQSRMFMLLFSLYGFKKCEGALYEKNSSFI